ncbi:glycosyltransferase family 2 protein [Roseibacterium sp. SDUM158016]|jgi:dolichol-phosphate mannosyltransferase|uniref:glycosyltransferase family 2 protein n=1 Tax=Roseicyclus sediminis TaxID=2980997 RepID=UPI0021D322BC|nr:glycosyltransferase family 2 protein [Roseibacterium sp. SDUM158016]MCU4652807.1 glycosyltransferase family 2 protein [Roseibacterium sp. SDUM158016]
MTSAQSEHGKDAADRETAPRFAIVIPMLDEGETAAELLEACRIAATPIGPFEFCVTDDGSRDGTGAALRAFAEAHPGLPVTIVTHARPAGQSHSVHDAVRAARAPLICTLDGDGQNPPEEIPTVLAPLLAAGAPERLGLVAGQRKRRNDPLPKRLASRAANTLRGWLLKDGTRDTGCGLKAFRRDAFLALPAFDHMHRFLPALFQRDGWQVAHVDVSHRPRVAGRSKYTNFGRAVVGFSDLLGVAWLIRRRRRLGPQDTTIDAPNGGAERQS